MPPPPLLDLAELSFDHPLADRAAIERVNPHRHEFALLDGVLLIDIDRKRVVGWHDVRADAFWVRGHIPGRPIFPGVMMIEASAQLASYIYHYKFPDAGFMGFAAADNVKFRGAVEPPARFVIVGEPRQIKSRRFVCYMQGFVNNSMVYEGELTGMPV